MYFGAQGFDEARRSYVSAHLSLVDPMEVSYRSVRLISSMGSSSNLSGTVCERDRSWSPSSVPSSVPSSDEALLSKTSAPSGLSPEGDSGSAFGSTTSRLTASGAVFDLLLRNGLVVELSMRVKERDESLLESNVAVGVDMATGRYEGT